MIEKIKIKIMERKMKARKRMIKKMNKEIKRKWTKKVGEENEEEKDFIDDAR